MPEYQVRTHDENPSSDSSVLLDFLPGRPGATIQVSAAGQPFFDGWRAPRPAVDLALLGAAAYCVDKTALRRHAADRWTRDITLNLPVSEHERWESADWPGVLNFLTGDRWTLTAMPSQGDPLHDQANIPDEVTPVGPVDGVCLFSGGLDSLAGVIELLEDKGLSRLCLMSHTEGGQASTAQDSLLDGLRGHYGKDRIIHRRLFLRPAPPSSLQTRPLPHARESTTRARSMLFLSNAMALAASVSPQTPVYIPENGFIGINVPLTRARIGSYSTRTTHPYYIKTFSAAAAEIGVFNPILNPFRLRTKGEILVESKNSALLKSLAPLSVSCSHPEAARYVQRPQGNCGYCFPCLIRRGAMHHAGWDNADDYAWNALDGVGLLDRSTRRAADLRAVIAGTSTDRPDRDVLRNGPIPDREHNAFVGVWRRGLDELRVWLAGATGLAAALIESMR